MGSRSMWKERITRPSLLCVGPASSPLNRAILGEHAPENAGGFIYKPFNHFLSSFITPLFINPSSHFRYLVSFFSFPSSFSSDVRYIPKCSLQLFWPWPLHSLQPLRQPFRASTMARLSQTAHPKWNLISWPISPPLKTSSARLDSRVQGCIP